MQKARKLNFIQLLRVSAKHFEDAREVCCLQRNTVGGLKGAHQPIDDSLAPTAELKSRARQSEPISTNIMNLSQDVSELSPKKVVFTAG